MTDRPQDEARPDDDRTRDITLPPLPDRPPPSLPREWAELARCPDVSATPPDVSTSTSGTADADAPTLRALPREDPRLPDQPTDKVRSPRLRVRPPGRTLAFSSPEMVHRPVDRVRVGRAPRRWPWVVLTLLPILVIAGAGITLLLLLRGA